MIRVCGILFCAVLVCSCLAGCQNRKTPVPDTWLQPVHDLVETSTETWDLREEDCAKSSQYKKEQNPVGSETIYTANTQVALLREACKQSYSFQNGRVAFVQFLFPDLTGSDLTRYYNLAENFTEHYGDGKTTVSTKGPLPEGAVELEGYWDIGKYHSNQTLYYCTQWTSHGKTLSLYGSFSPNNDTVLQKLYIQIRYGTD